MEDGRRRRAYRRIVAEPLIQVGTVLDRLDISGRDKPLLRRCRITSLRVGIRSEQGNCDLCFMKGVGKLKRLIREDPERAEWWIERERQSTTWRRKEPLRNSQAAS